jgi:hypothetical protein
MLDLLPMSPGDLVWLNSQRAGDALALLRAGSVSAMDHGFQNFAVKARGFDQLIQANTSRRHPVRQGSNAHRQSLLPR